MVSFHLLGRRYLALLAFSSYPTPVLSFSSKINSSTKTKRKRSRSSDRKMPGRGEYYKNKYGGGGRGGGRSGGGGGGRGGGGRFSDRGEKSSSINGGSYTAFLQLLGQLDGKSYGAYHDIETSTAPNGAGGWVHSDFILRIGRTQSDPFSPPTRCQIRVPSKVAQFPPSLYSSKIRAIALSDYLHRALYAHAKEMGIDANLVGNTNGGKGSWSGPKGGDIQLLEPCQHVLEQSAVSVLMDEEGTIVAQLTINLPARGRTILGQAAEQILGQTLPTLVQRALKYASLSAGRISKHVDSVQDQVWLQHQLKSRGLVAFVPNGAILPRASGVDDRPLADAVRFQTPLGELSTSFTLPATGVTVEGMGIPEGITLVCGGGFHGKSTLLEALQVAIYPKLPGDGREFCAVRPNAFKIRAEDGRSITSVDISTFIRNLPFGKDTTSFSTLDASGSTSQASNIVESLEMGTDVLLLDEDTCATNFMIRDNLMRQLVKTEKEPITPFLYKIRSLYQEHSVSTILVMGGVGEYFSVADTVLLMDSYQCNDATDRAKEIFSQQKESNGNNNNNTNLPFGEIPQRVLPDSSLLAPQNGKAMVRSKNTVAYGDIEMDLSGLEQVRTKAQTTTIVQALQTISSKKTQQKTTPPLFREVLSQLEEQIESEGLSSLAPGQFHGGMARVRSIDIAAAMNRFRSHSVSSDGIKNSILFNTTKQPNK